MTHYYMASSASWQDEPNGALWLATRAGKMEPTRCIPQAKFHQKPYNKSFIDQGCSVKMAEYWPRSFFASLLTSTSSLSINTQNKNLANIQPSWPHTWSITHTYYTPLNSSFGSMKSLQALHSTSNIPSPVLSPLSVTQRSALGERGSRNICLRMLVILASFLANRYCACTTR